MIFQQFLLLPRTNVTVTLLSDLSIYLSFHNSLRYTCQLRQPTLLKYTPRRSEDSRLHASKIRRFEDLTGRAKTRRRRLVSWKLHLSTCTRSMFVLCEDYAFLSGRHHTMHPPTCRVPVSSSSSRRATAGVSPLRRPSG